jgi:Fur family ferric uptake transcriptional regulator
LSKTSEEHLLQHHALRVTDFRVQVLQHFQAQSGALNLAELKQRLPAETDRVTLYRTLQKFESSGLIHSIPDPSGEVKYALCKHDCSVEQHHDAHAHFSCRSCGNTWCLDDWEFKGRSHPRIGRTDEVVLHLSGLCVDCQALESKA